MIYTQISRYAVMQVPDISGIHVSPPSWVYLSPGHIYLVDLQMEPTHTVLQDPPSGII